LTSATLPPFSTTITPSTSPPTTPDKRSRCAVSSPTRAFTSPAMCIIVRASTPNSPPASVAAVGVATS
jgi:hypothetical protein